MKADRLSADQVAWVCAQYRDGYSTYDIGDQLGRSGENIRQYLKQANIERRDRSTCQRRYTLNENFFDVIETEQQAYWLGFLAADASVQPQRHGLFVNLNPKDADHLQELAKALGSDFPLYYYPSHNEKYQSVRFTATSERLITALGRYGVTKCKTFTLQWPHLPQDLYPHFTRGYFDGDGCFVINSGHINFKITGNESFIVSLQGYLISRCGLRLTKTPRPNSKSPVCYLSYHGNRQVIRIANLLYQNATIYLSRKRILVLKHYQSISSYKDKIQFG